MKSIRVLVFGAFLVICRSLPATAACIEPPASLTGWWLGDGSGEDFIAGRDATPVNGATFGAGYVGTGAFQFDGVDDSASVADTAALNVGTGDFSVNFWVKPAVDGGEQVMVEKWNESSNTGWTLSDRGGLYFAGTGSAIQTSASIPAGVWTHIALQRSGGTVTLFKNGSSVDSGANANDLSSSVPLLFGRRRGGQGFYWNGSIDEIQLIVGSTLSNAEIQAIYAAGSEGQCTTCPNGTVDPGEDCDDNNTTDGDGCDSNCTATGCGNGIATAGEECDDGNAVESDACTTSCLLNVCGDGHTHTGVEDCDDGNGTDGDGCDGNCTVTGCGNGITSAPEQCDDANGDDNDACTNACTVNVCGDGIRHTGVEECDDGNAIDTDACTSCLFNVCGDGHVYIGAEECDDGNGVEGDGCDTNCTPTGCGNGIVSAPEVCDDGNTLDGDACDSTCQPSRCGNGVASLGRQCDATASSGASCVEECDSAWTSPFAAGVYNVNSLVAVGNNLVAGGAFEASMGAVSNSIALWNGATWSALGSGIDGEVYALASAGNLIYAGGSFATAGGITADSIAKWDGNAWSPLGGMDGDVRALAAIGSDVYAAGEFTAAGGMSANSIAKWDGNAWSPLGLGVNGLVRSLAVIGSDVYAAGDFTTAGGISANGIARWDGSSWHALGTGVPDEGWALAVIGTDLYAGGSGYLMRWDGANWSTVITAGFDITSMVAAGSDLVVSASFWGDPGAGIDAENIARWDGTAWYALGSGISDEAAAMAWDGSRVFVAGGFSEAGGKPTPYGLAIWTHAECGEQCDDGNVMNGDGCDTNCTRSACGNGIVAGGEACDDGNSSNGDGCDNNCTAPGCGNGIASPATGEMCDDGNAMNGDGCESNCTVTPVSQSVGAGGTVTTDTGGGATPELPVQTSITTPNAGTVTIGPPAMPSEPAGFAVVGVELDISAPPATVADPLVIVITVESAVIPAGVTPSQLSMTRNGVVIADCTDSSGTATPDPCIAGRVVLADNDVRLTVLTSAASLWSVVVRGMSRDEQKCVNGINGNGVKVAKAQGKVNAACLKAAADNEEPDAQGCLSADVDGKVGKAATKTAEKAADNCIDGAPFGLTNADIVNAAAQQAELGLMAAVFGDDLTGVVMTAAGNPAGALCQKSVLKAVQKLFETHSLLFLKCKKSGLKGKKSPLLVSGAQLQDCFDVLVADVDDKISKKVVKVADALSDKCAGVSLPTALPGGCAGAGNVGACLSARTGCRVCRMFNAMDGLAESCDGYDDGQLNGSCD